MPITSKDVILGSQLAMTDNEINECLTTSQHLTSHIKDRKDLHERDYLERFINIAQGEIAEQMVLKWLHRNGKFAESSVDKKSLEPDLGHDIYVRAKDGERRTCSIKSSLSVFKGIDDILSEFTLATKKSEIKDINIQVYFWLNVTGQFANRVNVLNTNNSAIIGWASKNQLTNFSTYKTEKRQAPIDKLSDMNSLASLLPYLT